MIWHRLAAVAFATLLDATLAGAQTYPKHPIQVIVPFAGGSASDVITRVVLERMGEAMGRRFIIDNRPGAGGNTGTAAGARAEPDGYTLLMSTAGRSPPTRRSIAILATTPKRTSRRSGCSR